MFFRRISKRYKHIKRYREIVEVLIKHGFGYLIEVMDLHQFVPLRKRIKKLKSSSSSQDSKAIRVRKVLEELGPTFVKLGQLLSTRPDLVPKRYIEELEKLQDQVPPMEFETVLEEIEQELGTTYQDHFKEISPLPLASASIGQVHKAILKDGQKVVIKVQRTSIEGRMETDLEIMSDLAVVLKNRVFADGVIDPVEIVDNFSKYIKQELDYRIEAKNAIKFNNNFSQESEVKIAKIFWGLTTRRMLTMEFIDGIKINNLTEESKKGYLAKLISKSFLKQILIDGFFHADPHPGNILITSDYKLALIDFGLVGQMSQEDREKVASLFIALIKKDMEQAIEELLELGMITREIDIKALKRDFYKLIDRYYGLAIKEIEFAPVLNQILELSFKYKIKLPIEFILLGKSLMTVERIVTEIDPEFDILEVARPFIYKIIKERLRPKRLAQDIYSQIEDLITVLFKLPEELHTIFKLVENDNLEITLRHIGIKRLISKLDIITNRLSVSMIISALVVGSSLIMLSDRGATLLGYPIIGISGYLIAALLGIWLVVSIIRSGRY
ncbi:AarF/ABC1/UbiB kinase family protein [Natroniella sulfidigena]|uniref:ABC1 kinase family protein n=1 Tax=Natroniella sulfidigena TaxID=723921 RepID=UPI00200ADDA8|nr:AarF/ABC1/UbiB kinase family protein [Natroniella sulfidigena]MCK8815974.1 AarF/ABC1/UbiB kinase family protein [Natroniella sulfidigena]